MSLFSPFLLAEKRPYGGGHLPVGHLIRGIDGNNSIPKRFDPIDAFL
jgi:hypothetical protein